MKTFQYIGLLGFVLFLFSFFPAHRTAMAQASDRQVGEGHATLDDNRVIPGQFIVVFKQDHQRNAIADAQQRVRLAGGTILHEYDTVFPGFAAKIPAKAVDALAKNPNIAYIEPDRIVTLSRDSQQKEIPQQATQAELKKGESSLVPQTVTPEKVQMIVEAVGDQTEVSPAELKSDAASTRSVTQPGAPWGLDRVDQRDLPLSGSYTYRQTGAGVHAYIIDSGIRHTHVEIAGRVAHSFTAIHDGYGAGDCHGHGTHVAGTVGSTNYGVAKAVTLHSIRVLNCQGSGSNSEVIAGINWVAAYHAKPAVANLSIEGYQISQAVQDSLRGLVAHGVTTVVAAGNSNTDACTNQFAGVNEVITVGAINAADQRTSFSNYGACVDIWAPGQGIPSLYHLDDSSIIGMDGTSMASPHVAGAVALYLQNNPFATPATVGASLMNRSTPNRLSGIGASVNRLLYTAPFMSAAPKNGDNRIWDLVNNDTHERLVGDINGDQREDIILIYPVGATASYNYLHTGIGVMLANGDGTYGYTGFEAPWGWSASSYHKWMIADVNGDRLSDVVLVYHAGATASYAYPHSVISVAFSNGNGTFGYTAVETPFGWTADASSKWGTGDVNGDGLIDVILIQEAGPTASYGYNHAVIGVAFSNGNGTFGYTAVETPFGWASDASNLWFAADSNNDGFMDVVLIQEAGPTASYGYNHAVIGVAFSNGNGTFGYTAVETPFGWIAEVHRKWFVGDANSDGFADVLLLYATGPTASYGYDHSAVGTAFSQGNGFYTFASMETPFAFGTANSHIWNTGDVNGDGLMDIMFVQEWGATATYGYTHTGMGTLISHGNGTFQAGMVEAPWGWGTSYVHKWRGADANANGLDDFVLLYASGPTPTYNYTHAAIGTSFSQGNGFYTFAAVETPFGWD